MAVSDAHHNDKVARHAWLRMLIAGLVAWTLLGWFTAGMDPNYAGGGLIAVVGGWSNWLGTGLMLIAAAMIVRAMYRRGGRRRALIGGPFVLAFAVALAASMNWAALFEIPLLLVGIVGVVVLLSFRTSSENDSEDRDGLFANGDGNGLRYGHSGWGHYVGNCRIDRYDDE